MWCRTIKQQTKRTRREPTRTSRCVSRLAFFAASFGVSFLNQLMLLWIILVQEEKDETNSFGTNTDNYKLIVTQVLRRGFVQRVWVLALFFVSADIDMPYISNCSRKVQFKRVYCLYTIRYCTVRCHTTNPWLHETKEMTQMTELAQK